MSANQSSADWSCVGVAQVGGGFGVAAGIYCFEFRSLSANFRGTYLFVGGGLGVGGSLGGGVAPSPGDFVNHDQVPDLWTPLVCRRPFSGDDLDKAYAALTTLGVGAAYGYAVTSISAGWVDPLFTDQNVSGWGTGVGVAGAMMPGVWIRIGMSDYY